MDSDTGASGDDVRDRRRADLCSLLAPYAEALSAAPRDTWMLAYQLDNPAHTVEFPSWWSAASIPPNGIELDTPLGVGLLYPMSDATFRVYLMRPNGSLRSRKVLTVVAWLLWWGLSAESDITDEWMDQWERPGSPAVQEWAFDHVHPHTMDGMPSRRFTTLADLVTAVVRVEQLWGLIMIATHVLHEKALMTFPAQIREGIAADGIPRYLDAGLARFDDLGLSVVCDASLHGIGMGVDTGRPVRNLVASTLNWNTLDDKVTLAANDLAELISECRSVFGSGATSRERVSQRLGRAMWRVCR